MELRELSTDTVADIYNQYMMVDFPPDERKPLARILYTMEIGLCCAYGIYEQDDLRGYAIFIVPEGANYGLLDYLAVVKEHRGTGVGHAFFGQIEDVLTAKYPMLRGFIIESENVEAAADASDRRTREKRISFYRQNNCAMTSLGSKLFGVTYSILSYDFDKRTNGCASLEDLDRIYAAMFQRHHYEHNVELWDNSQVSS
ncbi:MAG: GNAT family N-acetyltransferase [Lachnospiraceae bacterium]|nr:GNAT family N-acetyltransferase [Lachnospiraceae bacterium]